MSNGHSNPSNKVELVDRGRGMQLSTCRITVQDLVPYFQRNDSYDEIRRWIPNLTNEEIRAIEDYIRDHYDEVMEQDRRIRERIDRRTEESDADPYWKRPKEERLARLREKLAERLLARPSHDDNSRG